MNGHKVLSKTVLALGGFAALGISAPAFATTLISTDPVAIRHSDGAAFGNAYGDQLLKVFRWGGVAGIVNEGRSFSQQPQGGSMSPFGGMPVGAPVTSLGTAVAAPAATVLRPSSAVVYEAINVASNFQRRFGAGSAGSLSFSFLGGGNFNLNVPGNGFGLPNVPVNAPGLAVAGGNIAAVTAAQVPAVPEPATWLMLLVGFGLSGFVLRQRKSAPRVAFA